MPIWSVNVSYRAQDIQGRRPSNGLMLPVRPKLRLTDRKHGLYGGSPVPAE